MKKLILLIAVLAFTVTATAQIKVLSNGNVGIGTTNPALKLHVLGTSLLQGNVDMRGAINVNPYTTTDYAVYLDWTGEYGHAAIYSGSFRLILGKPSNRVYKIFAYQSNSIDYNTGSDERIKENITLLESPIEKIKQISGYRYNFKRDIFPEDISEAAAVGFMKNRIGFLAQEVEKVFPELVTHPQSEEEFCSMNYDGMIPVLLEAIKEQQNQIEKLQLLVSKQTNEMLLLQEQFDVYQNNPDHSLHQNMSAGENFKQNKEGKLFQNTPNPFNTSTEIKFEIPENSTSARLLIHDMQGAEIKSYSITSKGVGGIAIQGSELQAGMYMYTLLVNNIIVDSKRMILTK